MATGSRGEEKMSYMPDKNQQLVSDPDFPIQISR